MVCLTHDANEWWRCFKEDGCHVNIFIIANLGLISYGKVLQASVSANGICGFKCLLLCICECP